MIDNIKQWIEDFIEEKNWIIQVIYLLAMLLISILFNFNVQTNDVIVIELLFIIAGELYIISIKDSIMQKKVNRIDAKQDVDLGRLFRVADLNIKPFFQKAKNSIFVSGIALNGFFKNCRESMSSFLAEGKIVRILIASPKVLEENAKLYFGVKDDNKIKKCVKMIIRYQLETLEYILNEYRKYFVIGRIQVKISNCVFSTSFVAYDVMLSLVQERREIKASFYQYGCSIPEQEPNILLRSDDKREWYDFFEKTIAQQWDNAEEIDTEFDLKNLYELLEELYASYNG